MHRSRKTASLNGAIAEGLARIRSADCSWRVSRKPVISDPSINGHRTGGPTRRIGSVSWIVPKVHL